MLKPKLSTSAWARDPPLQTDEIRFGHCGSLGKAIDLRGAIMAGYG